VNLLTCNPEFLRYARGQLRPGKLLVIAVISLIVSLTIAFAFLHGGRDSGGNLPFLARQLLESTFYLQALILSLGGGMACLLAISSEKEQNTFDFQRVTALTPLELTLGKLFGAPILMYYICLCLAPLTIFAAITAHARPTLVLAAYVALLAGSIAFHALNLLLSLLAIKGGQLSGVALSLIALAMVSGDPSGGTFHIHPIGPFESARLATAASWQISGPDPRFNDITFPFRDVFFAHNIHHFPVLIVLNLTFTLWFLLAIVRNIKKDPEYYEIYSPLQFLSLALFLNLIFVGFFDVQTRNTPVSSSLGDLSLFLFFNMVLFFLLGLALLRTRARMHSLLRASTTNRSFSWNLFWPTPVLALGACLAAVLLIVDLNYTHPPLSDWNLPAAAFRSLVFILWIVGTLQYLQFMNLRPGKHPLIMAVLYLAIYYTCTMFILATLGDWGTPGRFPVAPLFVPFAVFAFDQTNWLAGRSIWLAGLALQLLFLTLCFYLQRRQIQKLLPGNPPYEIPS
jgi:hypothetical protein